jgi:hypothetical protein
MSTPSSSSAIEGSCAARGRGPAATPAISAARSKGELDAAFEQPLLHAAQIRSREQRQRGCKFHSFRAPEVECKGRASAPYEFGVKASIVTTNTKQRCEGAPKCLDRMVNAPINRK